MSKLDRRNVGFFVGDLCWEKPKPPLFGVGIRRCAR